IRPRIIRRQNDQPCEGCGTLWDLRRISKEPRVEGILPATQAIKGAQWLVRVDALTSESVRIAVQRVIERRPKNYIDYQYDRLIRLPGI
ncbi:hypothetical protein, partial [Bradyrhizobium embrapense]|uniref:hypothetical protein n=1 Tax=Bradyrhizobium embrapense TaxID=630921 RepID=UPI0019D40314